MEIRCIDVAVITDAIKEMCMEANYELSKDMVKALEYAKGNEHSPIGLNVNVKSYAYV